jgi:hypothetical protein
MRLLGDTAMTSGLLRELRDTYRDYKNIDGFRERDLKFFNNAHSIASFLKFSISNLKGEEIASKKKAVYAFRAFF